MSIILVGMPATGKTALAKMLEKEGFARYLAYTTRPPRKGEESGVDYNFLSEEEFLYLKKKRYFIETKSYKVANDDIWHYGSTVSFLYNPKGVIILDVDGVYAVDDYLIRHQTIKRPKIILLRDDLITIRNRMLNRGDDAVEIDRRIGEDLDKFIAFSLSHPIDHIYDGISLQEIRDDLVAWYLTQK